MGLISEERYRHLKQILITSEIIHLVLKGLLWFLGIKTFRSPFF